MAGAAATASAAGASGGAAAAASAAGADAGGAGGDAPRWYAADGDAFKLAAEKQGSSPSDADWMANKNYPTLADMVKGFRSLESRQAGMIALPKEGDAAALAEFRAKLGVPEKPDGYGIAAPEGINPAIATGYAEAAHKFGLTPEQAKGVMDFAINQPNPALDAGEASKTLRSDWGSSYDANLTYADRAMKELGLNYDEVDQWAAGSGSLATVYQKLAAFGKKLGEDGHLAGTGSGTSASAGLRTMEGIETARKSFMADKDKVAKLNAGDPATVQEWKAFSAAEAALTKQRYASGDGDNRRAA